MPSFERTVHGSAEDVYARIVDLRAYGDWLPKSAAYRGTEEISPGPMAVGTTFVERDPTGVRRGRVAELTAPRRVVFTQHLTPRPALLGGVDIEQTYELTPHEDHVHVRRTVAFTPQGALKVVFPVMQKLFVKENERIMDALEESGRHPTGASTD